MNRLFQNTKGVQKVLRLKQYLTKAGMNNGINMIFLLYTRRLEKVSVAVFTKTEMNNEWN